jgi:DNA-binding NarL/FixJ family response regulator
MKADRPTLLLADDHAIVTEGLRGLLEPDYEIVGTAADGAALVKAARALKPDVVIVDISMPKLNGIDAVREIRRARPKTRAIVLTMHADRTYVGEALEAGAAGFVVKHAASDEIRTALLTVLRGSTYVSPSVDGGERPRTAKLTPRQRQVLQLVAEGYTVKRIARALALSPKTVEFHKYRIMRDLGVKTTAELIQYAVEHGLAGGKD